MKKVYNPDGELITTTTEQDLMDTIKSITSKDNLVIEEDHEGRLHITINGVEEVCTVE